RQLWELWRRGQAPHVGDFLAHAGRLSPAQLVAVLRVDQRERWRHGDRIPAEDYLRQFPLLDADRLHALDPIYSEFLLREELGEGPAVAEYAGRFPHFAGEIRLQVELHWAIVPSLAAAPQAGPRPDPGLPAVPGYELLEVLSRGGM